MKKTLGTLAVLAGALALSGASYAAGVAHYNAEGMRRAHRALQVLPPHVFTTKARVAYLYTRGFGTDRSKNVADFQHIGVGTFCILPSATIDVNKIYPHVSIEWSTSSGFGLWAFWIDTTLFTECPTGYQEVKTYDLESGVATASDNISFDFTIG